MFQFCVHFKRKIIPKLDIINGIKASVREVRDDGAVHIVRSKGFRSSEIYQATPKEHHARVRKGQ